MEKFISILVLYIFYFTSTKHLFVIYISLILATDYGAGGPIIIPTLGITYSQPGNQIFPAWE